MTLHARAAINYAATYCVETPPFLDFVQFFHLLLGIFPCDVAWNVFLADAHHLDSEYYHFGYIKDGPMLQ